VTDAEMPRRGTLKINLRSCLAALIIKDVPLCLLEEELIARFQKP
jgi:hypothetical protein